MQVNSEVELQKWNLHERTLPCSMSEAVRDVSDQHCLYDSLIISAQASIQ